MPLPDWLAGETVPASSLKKQTVHICTTGTRPTGFEGLTIYETDTNTLRAYDGATWQLIGDVSTGTSHTPTLAQGATGNISKTVNYSEYRVANGMCTWWFNITCTGTGTAAAAVTLTLPVTSVTSAVNVVVGSGFIIDSSVDEYIGVWKLASSTTVGCITNGSPSFIGANPNFALANTDVIEGTLTYPVI